ncbi:cell envelope integrity protein TolA [Thiobacillus sp. 65-1402]|uniref:cell envelope integrity protein TolA n=1 Tax=Thiobacillus sp. 65-1402 TaxID=1895861 RepID=UPI00092BB44A|nr:cell envelope integrity protein TolA [Thiobacillus sp. 65-1402]OJW46139.1 MAG: protein TolA [Thiobacillus sp. 65-1059]OJW76484.1 MAG: protein TolA [Thiobacillus sp. 65-1402]
MNLPADAPFVSRPAPRLAAGVLALGVHAVFVLLLVFGVSWQTQRPAPVMVDLWETLPKAAPPAALKPPEPPPPPQVKTPAPAKVAPAPKAAADEPPPPRAPDIALEKKKAEVERLQRLKAIQAEEEKARAEAARVEAEAARKAHEKQLAEQKKRELLRQMEEEDLMRRMADEEAASEALAMRQAEARAAAGKRQAEVARVVGQHRDQISAKVRGNTRLPDNLKGNPEVRCAVRLLPTGEVQSVRVTQSSGNAAYDEAVVRAIVKSSPLPLPADRDARAAFVPELSFVHRPKE